MEYRQGDVQASRTRSKQAFRGADVVVHLAFMITGGTASRETIRAINVEGTLNAFRAAAAAGAKRFVYASSVAAYGFHRDNPERITEEWPTRPASRLFYAQEKAEIERLLRAEAEAHPELELYLLRPPIVLGPHAVGAKDAPARAPRGSWAAASAGCVRDSPVPLPVLVPSLRMQFIHEDDVGQAFLQCIVAAGPPGAYNITGDGVLTGTDVARELGLGGAAGPGGRSERRRARARRAVGSLPFLPPAVEWVEAATRPVDHGRRPRPSASSTGSRATRASRPYATRSPLDDGRLRRRHRDHRQRLLRPRDGDPAQAGGDRGLHGARTRGRRRRHLALQHVSGLRVRRPVAPLLVLLRPQSRVERDVLAPAPDPRLPAARRR